MADKNLHIGHRTRMRDRFAEYGKDTFHTYELLEMLLYSSIPLKDTNELAKRLLDSFSGLDGVFSQAKEHLCELEGIGERTAELITSVAKLDFKAVTEKARRNSALGYFELGERFVYMLGGTVEQSVQLMLMNGRLEPIRCVRISDSDYGSASLKVSSIVDLAVEAKASVAIIAHNHPYGPAYPTPQDVETNKSVKAALSAVGVTLAEHYIIAGHSFYAFMHHSDEGIKEIATVTERHSENFTEESFDLLSEALSFQSKEPSGDAAAIRDRFHTLRDVAEADVYSISDALSSNLQTAVYIKLIFAIASRRICDKFKFKAKHKNEEIYEFVKAFLLDASDECVCLVTFSEDGKTVACDVISHGTVNYSDILPRKVLETARRRGSHIVLLAHNHPGGAAQPSSADTDGTKKLSAILASQGVRLVGHLVVAGGDSSLIDF